MGRRGAHYGRAIGAVFAALAGCVGAAVVPGDVEQGLPIISTFLPSRYNTPASPVGPQAFALASLADGSIVAANNSGLLRLNGASATAWNPTGGNVLSLASGADGTLYFGGVGEIGWCRDFGGEFHTLAPEATRLGSDLGDVWITVVAHNDDVYFADTTHVFRWDGHELRLAYAGQPELLVGAPLGAGAAVLDPGAGLIAVNANGARLLPGSERLLASGPCALAAARDSIVSVCSDASVLRWREHADVEELPLAPPVRDMLGGAGVTTAGVRDDGMLLIGTRRAGMLMLDRDGALIGHLAAVPEWGDSRVFSQLLRHDDGFWVGLDYGVAHVEWPGQLSRFDASLGLPRAALATVRVNGQLLAATTRGLYRLAPPPPGSAFAHFQIDVPTRTTLFALAQSGDAVFLASGDGVYRVHDGAAQLLDTQLAYAVMPLDRDGDVLLVGGLRGARVLRKRGDTWIAQPLRGISTEIRHLQADGNGGVWLAGNYSGAYHLRDAAIDDTPDVETFGAAQGLPAGRILPLRLPDGLAFDSSEGLLRFDAAARRFVPDAALRALLPRALGATRFALPLDAQHAYVVQHDRVRLIERTGSGWRELFTPLARLPRGLDFRDVRVDADGGVWIAGNDALFHHRPQLQSALPELPQPRAMLKADDGSSIVAGPAAVNLGTAPRTVRAHFEEAFFDGVDQLNFRTRLDPLESAWSEWQALPEREMTQLPDGEYQLLVQARDTFGRESAPATLAFSLAPPWFLRWWALASYAGALGLLLALMIRLRESNLRRRAEELSELVSARTQELERASVTDALTGLRNRHYVQLLEPAWRERKRGWWLIALVDIDYFKRINDDHGHAAGDEVLRAVAQRLGGVLSEAVTAVRWGGEEFLIVGELDDARGAAPLMRKLLCAIGNEPVAIAGMPALAVTCSIGWEVVAVEDALSLDTMLASADQKLYAAKRSGRDRALGPDNALIVRA
jgi:diguanylate cyclase (GGDEF)-like protein